MAREIDGYTKVRADGIFHLKPELALVQKNIQMKMKQTPHPYGTPCSRPTERLWFLDNHENMTLQHQQMNPFAKH